MYREYGSILSATKLGIDVLFCESIKISPINKFGLILIKLQLLSNSMPYPSSIMNDFSYFLNLIERIATITSGSSSFA